MSYNLYSVTHNERLFIRVNLDDGETLPTITGLWKGSSFMEREVYDMFGVEFEGHPDLRKLITPEDLDGHPTAKTSRSARCQRSLTTDVFSTRQRSGRDERAGVGALRLAWRRAQRCEQSGVGRRQASDRP